MARPKHTFGKRQSDLAKKRKQEEKRQRKRGIVPTDQTPDGSPESPAEEKTDG